MKTVRQPVVVGVHATEQALSLPHRDAMDLALEAVTGAIADAGLRPSDVDGAQVDWPGPGGVPGEGSSWARLLGNLRWTSDAMLDNAGSRGLLKAAAAVSAGLADTVVVGGCRLVSRGTGPVGAGVPVEFADVWGSYVVAQFALVAARHMHQFGTTPRQLAEVAATIRNNGSTNPEAMMYGRGPYTADDVLASRMVATPFHLLDCCIVGEGGGAFVVTTAERARDLPRSPVAILGGGMEFHQAAYANPALYREVGMIGRDAAARAFGTAGVGPAEVDVFSLYDPNSFEVIRQLEALGVCEEGEGGPLVETGAIAVDGKYPVNPDGGCLSYAWNGTQQMTLKVVEAVRQLRGTAVHQVTGAEVAVVGNAGSGAQHYEMSVLGRI
ncbi:thiolase family protein [Amycolatopsis balhimycina DSM 5908]|uniref:Thiolase family protein n=1 Tax=Amycolatopsis balhimycina DSM 5908 TaxID=1081091 RepID=A0A428WVE6_AMYBA|nr:thiolase family protein [Amycolatopsis balhimycina]RSM47049.1 thiolase family protein [Amycolatopsis balhimycina DSM 5908]